MEILRGVEREEKLRKLGKSVAKIRRTQKKELLLQLNNSGEQSTAFRSLVREMLGENAEVPTLSHRVKIECKDLDEITTREDICERTSPDQAQTAAIRLPAESVKKALSVGILKVVLKLGLVKAPRQDKHHQIF